VTHRLGVLALACLSGTLLVLSFPPLRLGALAWIALVPLLVVLDGRAPRVAFALSYLAGLVFTVGTFAWIWSVPGYNLLDEVLLALYLGVYMAVWGSATAWVRRRTALPLALVAPVLWVALEYIRSNLSFLSLPWMLLGHTQHASIPTIQIASLTGVYGLTFLIVLVNVALAESVRYARGRVTARVRVPGGTLIAAGLLLSATWLYGVSVTRTALGPERIAAALVHTSVPRDLKWDLAQRRSILERNEALTRMAAGSTPQLIVWPETAVPGDVLHHAPLRLRVGQTAREANTTLLVGSAEHAKFTDRRLMHQRYNSMYLVSPTGEIVGQYRKITLVPFGEYEPLQGVIRWPKAIAAAMGSHLAGDRHTVFSLGSVHFSAVVCWEIVFPDLVRRFVQGGARFIVNASNEAWFAGSAMPDQMLAISVFRAVENRTAVARSANFGISAIIDPYGRISRRFPGAGPNGVQGDGVLTGDIPLAGSGTLYTRHGDVFALACSVAVLVMLAGAWFPSVVGRWLGFGVPAGTIDPGQVAR
jgi:apolipoprotein N-acyltransferase